jgi:hypothetical protein
MKSTEGKKILIDKGFKEIDNNPFIPKRPLLGFGPSVIWDKTTTKLKLLLSII